jgi:hypothetical protein
VESSCEFGIEPSGSIKCWESSECRNNWRSSSGAELHRVSWLVRQIVSSITPLIHTY